MRLGFYLIWPLLWPAPGAAEHNALLPRPQQVRYGSHQFPARGLSIHFASAPTAEDRFSAQNLSSCLSDRMGAPVPVAKDSASELALVLRRTGTGPDLPIPEERPGSESREAYSLSVTPQGGEVRASSSAGLFYGVQTLCQMIEGQGADAALPEVEIRDWPSLAYRGIMVDMSHGPLPTEEEVKLRIVAYARERHVGVVPCLELYGHLHDVFRVERYADLAAVPHGSEFNPLKPQVTSLLEDWVDQMATLFPSPFVHVGMDETWELERFAKAEAGGLGPGELYLKHFKSVAGLVNRRGRRVMVWADIFSKYPEIIAQLPAGTVVVPWSYGPENDYNHFLKPFASANVAKFIATGVTVWNQIAPDFDLSFDNIDTFLSTGRQYGISGHINTIWSDDAQVLMRSAFPGIAYGAAAGWQGAPVGIPCTPFGLIRSGPRTSGPRKHTGTI
ncbi:MAG: hypothetical protein DMG23_11165 [Acidobacteria bacterium]|nr:MAG: hypothetical protein DMG23_11165 [Acidobacteriota bacterium]